jgi:transmembrane sensor
MSIKTDRIRLLIELFDRNQISEEEFRELFTLIRENKNEAALKNILQTGLQKEQGAEPDNKRLNLMLQKILQTPNDVVQAHSKRKRFGWIRVAAAAIVILVLGSGAYLWMNHSSEHDRITTSIKSPTLTHDIAPGGNKAVLLLADGSSIVLDSAAKGTLARQGNTEISKTGDGSLLYNAGTSSSAVLYNTLSTPRGGQYQISLPDGTKVWMNAASSLRYPTAFLGKQREVELNGEAYFEVAHLTHKGGQKIPFIVHVDPFSRKRGMKVEVLGTHFNVMAYNDENSIRTTLLEGSVKVIKENETSMLKAGQQAAFIKKENKINIISNPDLDLAVAWKNGYTSFRSADIKTIMHQVTRWYDVDIVYESDIPERTFTGEVPRDARLSELLKIFEASNIHFIIEGRVIKLKP